MEKEGFAIPPPLSPASGGILGSWLINWGLWFFLGGTSPFPRRGKGWGWVLKESYFLEKRSKNHDKTGYAV